MPAGIALRVRSGSGAYASRNPPPPAPSGITPSAPRRERTLAQRVHLRGYGPGRPPPLCLVLVVHQLGAALELAGLERLAGAAGQLVKAVQGALHLHVAGARAGHLARQDFRGRATPAGEEQQELVAQGPLHPGVEL